MQRGDQTCLTQGGKKVVEQRRYMSIVIAILREEGLYSMAMSNDLYVWINKRISENHQKGLTVLECVKNIKKELQHARA
jgi:hypothetical protein